MSRIDRLVIIVNRVIPVLRSSYVFLVWNNEGAGILIIFLDRSSATQLKSSRRELTIDVAEHEGRDLKLQKIKIK